MVSSRNMRRHFRSLDGIVIICYDDPELDTLHTGKYVTYAIRNMQVPT